MIDYGGGLIFPDSWAYGPPDRPECPECPDCGGDPTQDVQTGEDPCWCGVEIRTVAAHTPTEGTQDD